MAPAGPMSLLQARALKMKQRAKAEKKAKRLARAKGTPPILVPPPPAATELVPSSDGGDNDNETRRGGAGEEEDSAGDSGSGPESDSESQAEGEGASTKSVNISSATSISATFESLGLITPLLDALKQVGYTKPTEIQSGVIPDALEGKDVIGVAETGSGKTAAFALPILQKLWDEPRGLFACVLAPTRYVRGSFLTVSARSTEGVHRELAYQISQQFEALGSAIGVRCATIVGGMDMMSQSIALGKRPHIVVATPGRLNDHLENTKGFSLRGLRYLVLDEADRLLDMDFGPVIDKILKVLPRERNTFLFSATMSTKVAKLQRASLQNPVRVEVNGKYSTVSTLLQYYLLTPFVNKDVHLVHLANELAANSAIVFTRTVHDAQRLSMVLRNLGFPAVPLHGQLSQSARLGALNKFKAGGRSLLIATDVASRGLDIPAVDVVINFDIPTHSKDYIHRVGRTARAGRAGKSITLVTQYDVELLQRIEGVIGKKMMDFGVDKAEVMLLKERVGEAQRLAIQELKDAGGAAGARGGRKRQRETGEGGRERMDRDDDVVEAGMPSRGKK
ncbi:ribosomal RNA processing protein, partial [Ceratobasidium sp. 414]